MAKKNKSVAEPWRYITAEDRELPKDQQTVFVLRPMTWAERDLARDLLSSDTVVRRQARQMALDHIVSIENFPVGAPQAWPSGRAEREDYLNMLDDGDVLEIGNEVWARSTLGPDEQALKNSFTPERTPASGEPSPGASSTAVPSVTVSPA